MRMPALAVLIVTHAASVTAAPTCKYKIELLTPSMAGYDFCLASGLSDKGYTVGTCTQEQGEETRAFLYRGGVTTNVGVLSGFNQGRGFGVNNHGDVVGYSGVSFDPTLNDAFLFHAGAMENIEQWASFAMGDTVASDINDAGQIIGSDDYDRAVYWQAGQDPIYLAGEIPTRANAINASGQIVGAAQFGSGRHIVRWDNLVPVDLGALPGGYSEGNDIADNGFIAGTGFTPQGARAFFYDPGTAQLTVIGTLGGANSYGNGVSSAGVVVGYATDPGAGWNGFVWRSGRLYELDQLVSGNSPTDPWDIQSALAINEKGEILALAYNSTSTGYLLLHPQTCGPFSSRCCPF